MLPKEHPVHKRRERKIYNEVSSMRGPNFDRGGSKNSAEVVPSEFPTEDIDENKISTECSSLYHRLFISTDFFGPTQKGRLFFKADFFQPMEIITSAGTRSVRSSSRSAPQKVPASTYSASTVAPAKINAPMNSNQNLPRDPNTFLK